MADAQRSIDIIINAIDKTQAGIGSSINNIDSFAGKLEQSVKPISDITNSAIKLEAALLATGAAMTTFAVVKAAEFETALVDLQKVLSEGENIDAFADAALNLSEAYGQSSVEVLSSVANFKQAGFTAEEAGLLTKSAFDLVISGGVEAATASEGLVASIKGFGAAAGDSTAIVDLFNEVSNNFGASASQLLEGFSQLSPVASAAGLSLEETVGIMTPVIEVFQSGSEAATGLKTSFLNLISDNKKVTDTLTALGVSQKDVNGELRSARDIYFDVAEAFQGLTSEQQLFYAGQIAGKNQVAKFTAALNGLATTNEIAGDSFNYVGSAQAEVDAQLDTLASKYEQLGVKIDNALIKVGNPLVDSYKGIVDALGAVFQALGQGVEESDQVAGQFDFLNQIFGSFQQTLLTIAENLPAALDQADLSGFSDGIQEVIDGIDALLGDTDLTSVDGIVTVIETLGGAFEGLGTFVGSALESWEPLIDLLSDGIEGGGLTDDLKEIIETAGTIGGAAQQVTLLTGAIQGVLPSLESLVQLFVAGQLLRGVTNVSDGIKGKLIPALTGPTGLLVAAGATGVALGNFLNKFTEDATGTSASDWLADQFWAIDQFFGITETSTQALIENAEAQERVGDSSGQLASAANEAADAIDKVNEGAEENTRQIFNFSTGLFETVPAIEQVAQTVDGFAVGPMAVLNAQLEWSERAAAEARGEYTKGAEELSKTAKAAQKTEQELKKMDEAAAKIAVQERIALIEAQAQITSTAIEADAEKIKAAFEAIGISVGSTGDAISSLYGLLGDGNISKFDKLDIKAQIEDEAEARARLLDLQYKQTEQQIRESELRLAALEDGGALITINGDGLAPHLEAFMWEVLSAIQVRASNEGYDLILGAIDGANNQSVAA